ncbi:sterigmatocystin biosynthesis dehydrogenase stcV [Penicillium chermesinum]|uniref:Sterigmatocystin biosynthesis dehydrogenase stcV n=1 Tax=Penicillium chermesinum TaxID=63820 RepID=A0A9W9TQ89_9EURO|nr:sterigmatocystin biosynthesis dehydrogenase stcV [Penicillium chermesinum]KAJ5233064.1 sterigmatocystin biosynthesis dehydrogenase stcV [Penicillium chermesinum]
MNFGDAWKSWMGECGKEQSFAILDAFFKLGGNFIDTANNYQNEESETWIGEWLKARGVRDQMVIATKYTTGFRNFERDVEPIQSNFVGNSMKSMRVSVERSLKKLQTDYIDLLYVHWWDFTTSVEEVMHGLNNLVTSGKVLYLGVSDTPAWIVVKANAYARANGLRPFSVYQGKWNARFRDLEREVIPMCRDQGMGIAPWAALGQGKFRSAEARKGTNADGSGRAADLSEEDIKISEALEKVAKKKNTTLQAIRKIEHLEANVAALGVSLSQDDIHEIDNSTSFDIGFPLNFIFRNYSSDYTASDVFLTNVTAHVDVPSHVKPVQARQA